MNLQQTYTVAGLHFTKRSLYGAAIAFLIGLLIGGVAFAAIAPTPAQLTKLYKEQGETLLAMKRGEINAPEDVYIHHASELRSDNEKEFIEDIIRSNSVQALAGSRVATNVFPANEETRQFSLSLIAQREAERAKLLKLYEKYYGQKK